MQQSIEVILENAARRGASDIFLIGGLPLTYKVNGKQLREEAAGRQMPETIAALVGALYSLTGRPAEKFPQPTQEDDFSFALPGLGRFRANVFYQRGSLSAVIRVIRFGLPDPAQLGIPAEVLRLGDLSGGLVLVTGPSGSGKSTTLACIIDAINEKYDRTIITMEDPIEIVHAHKKSIVIQREIATDTKSYLTALRAALRESPDVLFIGEISDADTMEVAMTAAETGQLLFSTLHTLSVTDTVDRVLDTFPPARQQQVRLQLSRVLKSVVCQQLIPTKDGHLVPAFEILHVTPAVRNLIREGKTYQLGTIMQEGAGLGMRTMNASLLALVQAGSVEHAAALLYSSAPALLEKRLGL